jgi:hypothetical protein
MRFRRWWLLALLVAGLGLGACGGGGSGGALPPGTGGNSNWDEMKWDQDKWSWAGDRFTNTNIRGNMS